jgi:hypothetical protein
MPPFVFSLRHWRKAKLLWSSVALALLAGAALAGKHLPTPRRTAAAAQSPAVQSPAAASQATPQIERITIRPTGFDPAALTLRGGRFLLAVDNRSGLEEVALAVTSEHGSRVREARVHRNRLDWRQQVNLPPGRYTLTEADHPTWVCDITVTDN